MTQQFNLDKNVDELTLEMLVALKQRKVAKIKYLMTENNISVNELVYIAGVSKTRLTDMFNATNTTGFSCFSLDLIASIRIRLDIFLMGVEK